MQFTAIVSQVDNSVLSFFKLKYTFKDNLHELLWSQLFVTIVKHRKLQCFPVPFLEVSFSFLCFLNSFAATERALLT